MPSEVPMPMRDMLISVSLVHGARSSGWAKSALGQAKMPEY